MPSTSILIVEDSQLVAKYWSRILKNQSDFEVIGIAESGEKAMEYLENGMQPDVMLLDIIMPGISGLEVLEIVVRKYPDVRVIVVSRLTSETSQTTVQALIAGASDYFLKPTAIADVGSDNVLFARSLFRKIRNIVGRGGDSEEPSSEAKDYYRSRKRILPNCIVVGASTGGPEALSQFLAKIDPQVAVPILLVQHIPEEFCPSFAEQLTSASGRTCLVATSGMPIERNKIYLAPGNRHMVVVKSQGKYIVRLNSDAPLNSCRPSVDYLFLSAAHVYKDNLLGVVLTGMGEDGRRGAIEIVRYGGEVVVQDRETSVVWAMPGVIAADGNASAILPASGLGDYINDLFKSA